MLYKAKHISSQRALLKRPLDHPAKARLKWKRHTAPCAGFLLISLIDIDTGTSALGLTKARRRAYSSACISGSLSEFFSVVKLLPSCRSALRPCTFLLINHIQHPAARLA